VRSPLVVLSTLIGLLVALPVLSVGANLFGGDTGATWSHLAATVLP
jgi:iron(III) transport system permease protein